MLQSMGSQRVEHSWTTEQQQQQYKLQFGPSQLLEEQQVTMVWWGYWGLSRFPEGIAVWVLKNDNH